jgi:DNA-binding GntR family transcriptional regulator
MIPLIRRAGPAGCGHGPRLPAARGLNAGRTRPALVQRIAAWLLGRIDSGELAIGQPVPSEKELMDLFGVARTTVRRAIAYLRDQAAIQTVPGRGSYVAKRRS